MNQNPITVHNYDDVATPNAINAQTAENIIFELADPRTEINSPQLCLTQFEVNGQ